jgi:hypothetical protein
MTEYRFTTEHVTLSYEYDEKNPHDETTITTLCGIKIPGSRQWSPEEFNRRSRSGSWLVLIAHCDNITLYLDQGKIYCEVCNELQPAATALLVLKSSVL